MADIPYIGQTTDIILGQEFLTWLWFTCDNAPASFRTPKDEPVLVSMEQRVVVQGGEGDSLETTSVSGSLSPLREARVGLATGKKVVRALLRVEKDDLAWQCTLKAEDFSFNSLKTPRIERDDDADEDALLLERLYLYESFVEIFDALYARFLTLRLSDGWRAEVAAMQRWFRDEG